MSQKVRPSLSPRQHTSERRSSFPYLVYFYPGDPQKSCGLGVARLQTRDLFVIAITSFTNYRTRAAPTQKWALFRKRRVSSNWNDKCAWKKAIKSGDMASEVQLDALPYVDQGYDDPGVREAVSFFYLLSPPPCKCVLFAVQAMQLVEEETRRYRPTKNYLDFLQPPKSTFEVYLSLSAIFSSLITSLSLIDGYSEVRVREIGC